MLCLNNGTHWTFSQKFWNLIKLALHCQRLVVKCKKYSYINYFKNRDWVNKTSKFPKNGAIPINEDTWIHHE